MKTEMTDKQAMKRVLSMAQGLWFNLGMKELYKGDTAGTYKYEKAISLMKEFMSKHRELGDNHPCG